MFHSLILLIVIFNICNSFENNNKRDEGIFVATKEWKILPKGQKIPKGLHVRINFETGLTEAKLLDENDDDRNKNSLVAISKDEEPVNLSIKDEKSLKDQLKQYKKPKHNLKKSNLPLRNETRILYNLINDDNLHPLDRIKALLDQLDKPPDISSVFIKLEGFEKLIYPYLNSTNEDILCYTLNFLGSLAQNNPLIKVYAVETGSLPYLHRFLSGDSNEVKHKAVFALGSILRQFPFAQKNFLENGGFISLIHPKRLSPFSLKTKVRIVFLLNDLISEYKMSFNEMKSDGEGNLYEKIDTVAAFIQLGYCDELNDLMRVFTLFVDKNYDEIEKCVIAMKEMEQECKFFKEVDILEFLFKLSKHLKNIKEDENYPQLVSIINKVKKNSTDPIFKEEL